MGVGLGAAAQRLGQGRVRGDRDRAPGQVAGGQFRQAGAHPGRAQRGGGVHPDERAQQHRPHDREDAGGGAPQHPGVDERQRDHHGPQDPARPRRRDRAGQGAPGERPHTRAQDPTAVQRQPGQQVEDAHQEVGHPQLPHQHPDDGVGGRQQVADEPGRGQDQRQQRTAEGDPELLARLLGLAFDLRDPAEHVEGDAAHRQPVVARDHAVREFVHQHRGVQQHGEDEGHQVGGGAQGQGVLDHRLVEQGEQDRDDRPGGGDVDGDSEGASHPQPSAAFFGTGGLGAAVVGSVWLVHPSRLRFRHLQATLSAPPAAVVDSG